MELQNRFCKTPDGIRIAYTTLGQGSPFLICPGWISHLHLNWESPKGQAFLESIARSHTVIMYDRHGSGLSERKRTDFSLDSEIRTLQAVVDHLKLRRFILFGYSLGGLISAAYVSLYPRRVSHLILYGTYARRGAAASEEFKTAFNLLFKSEWEISSRVLSDMFIPDAEPSVRQWFSQSIREEFDADLAVPFFNMIFGLDVTDLLPKIGVPTLVMHRREDRAVPFHLGREVAATIPGARFVQLDGNIHLLMLGDVEPILHAISEFLGDPIDASSIRPAARKYLRKLTAILSADVKDYSRLMGQDEEGTLGDLKASKEVIAGLIKRYRGRWAGSAGDSVLAEFASAVDAVECAVEIQQVLRSKNVLLPETRRMEFRIGINLGDVIEEGETVYGDGVNIAARLEGLADAGGICISGIVYDQVEKKLPFTYEYLGEQSVKNIEKPVRVYRVLMEAGTAVSHEAGDKKSETRQ